MRVWIPCFLAFTVVGLTLLTAVLRRASHHRQRHKLILVALGPWLLFSGFAAEITRLYLAVYPLPAWACAMGAVGVALLGAITGLLTGWFVGGQGVTRVAADSAAGALGALVAAWAEITSSYNHAEYVIAIIVIGAAFFTFILRCAMLRSRFEAPG